MDKFGKSQPVRRFEDVRFLTGRGRYVDDIAPEGALHGFFFRSPVAHAKITRLDVSEARGAEGVHLVLTWDDLQEAGVQAYVSASVINNLDGSRGANPKRPALAAGRVRHVGEPLALIVAETLAEARDAAELIEFEYEDLPVHVNPVPGGPALHEEAPDNVAFHWGKGAREATEAALASAAHRVSLDIVDNRVIANPMETRGCFAEWDGERVHVCFNGQGVWDLKGRLAKAYGLAEDRVRVTNPDVGGGFGMKAFPYPEYMVLPEAARRTGRAVRWQAERTEGMLTDAGGRALVSTCELAFDENFRITAYRVNTLCDLGAYNSPFAQFIQSDLFSRVLTGVYDIQTTWLEVRGIYTNTAPVDAYRGAGRPEAIFALERLIDHAARELGIDPLDLRRRNFIPPAAFPYKTAMGETYDVGDFPKVLARAETEADLAGFAARRAESERRGLLRGLGLCFYIESILGDPTEGATLEFNEDGTVNLYVGTQSNGQGHETVYARFVSDQTGIPADKVNVIQGDSDLIATGGGTGGSRSVTTQNNATLATVGRVIEKFTAFLAEELGVAPDDIEFDDVRFRATGSNLTPTMLEVAEMARARGRNDLLRTHETATLPARSFPNGVHVAEVEIDPETGRSRVVRYSVTDDFGNMINPLLVEGQVHGGVAQGIGQAMTERVVYDEDGQLLTASFMDYAMPRAEDLPFVHFVTEPVPSTANVMGMKGCGEAGTVGALAAVANAVNDALASRGAGPVDMPFTPQRVWQSLSETGRAAA